MPCSRSAGPPASDVPGGRGILLARKLTDSQSRLQALFANAAVGIAELTSTGEVTLDFGEEYFETGSSGLKPGMQKILKDTFPIYAKSLPSSDARTDQLTPEEAKASYEKGAGVLEVPKPDLARIGGAPRTHFSRLASNSASCFSCGQALA